MQLEGLLAEGGPLAVLDPDFESRPQQLSMAKAVAESLATAKRLVVEAPTGVGKSLAYLLPSALWAVEGRRVLVSTYSRALQEQLLGKELPLVSRLLRELGMELRYAMIQGSDNYLCVQKLERLRSQPDLFGESSAGAVEEIFAWAQKADSGHRSRLPHPVPQALWSDLSRDPDLCLGPSGRFWSACLYRRDRENAERSHILVVNHALLLSGAKLPPYDALVVDEAHHLEDAGVSHFGVSFSQLRVEKLGREIRLSSSGTSFFTLLERCRRESEDFLMAVARQCGLKRGQPEGASRLLEEGLPAPPLAAWAELEKALSGGDGGSSEAALEARTLAAKVGALRADLTAILSAQGPESARWVEWGPHGLELKLSPLDVSSRLGQALFSRDIPVVMTSATLSGSGGLREFKAHVGLSQARELVLDSPFDHRSQAGLLVAEDVPEPSEEARYATAVAARCLEVIRRVPGGVFILFSSWKMLKRVHTRLRRRVKDRPLWTQGQGVSPDVLITEFVRSKNAVLLGVDTLWHGVDVPGEALSCVVLVKLPFPSYASPVETARRRFYEELGRDYFHDYSLPKAVVKFRQGFGRIIRSSLDRGVVVVLDSRLLERGYGQVFLEALPPCRRLKSWEELSSFFDQKEKAAR